MKNLVEFVEIPAVDFSRAVKFYETVFGVQLTVFDCTPSEKMAFFPHSGPKPGLAISWAAGFLPSKDGVLVSLNVESIEAALECIRTNGGKTLRPKTKRQYARTLRRPVRLFWFQFLHPLRYRNHSFHPDRRDISSFDSCETCVPQLCNTCSTVVKRAFHNCQTTKYPDLSD